MPNLKGVGSFGPFSGGVVLGDSRASWVMSGSAVERGSGAGVSCVMMVVVVVMVVVGQFCDKARCAIDKFIRCQDVELGKFRLPSQPPERATCTVDSRMIRFRNGKRRIIR